MSGQTETAEQEDTRIAAIKAAMGDDSYWTDPKMQAEYLRLQEAKGRRVAAPADAR